MSEKDKRKLCWNCEGSVLRHLETCPYCGVYLSPTEQDINNQSLIPPPYPEQEEKKIPDPIYRSDEEDSLGDKSKLKVPVDDGFLPSLLMLVSGTSLMLFGLSLWLFSDKGHLTLSWNDDWAPLFLLIAVPLLLMGGRSLSRLKDT